MTLNRMMQGCEVVVRGFRLWAWGEGFGVGLIGSSVLRLLGEV